MASQLLKQGSHSLIAGLGGSAPLAIGAGSISDLFAEQDRAVAMSLFSLGPLMGPIIGPVIL
jgi:MFS family permease